MKPSPHLVNVKNVLTFCIKPPPTAFTETVVSCCSHQPVWHWQEERQTDQWSKFHKQTQPDGQAL